MKRSILTHFFKELKYSAAEILPRTKREIGDPFRACFLLWRPIFLPLPPFFCAIFESVYYRFRQYVVMSDDFWVKNEGDKYTIIMDIQYHVF